MTSSPQYKKDDDLRRRINGFLQSAFALPKEDYYARLSPASLLGLKSALSDVNNAVTMRLTLGFLDWASAALSIDAAGIEELRATVMGTKPSSNGYDLYCPGPKPFAAEVKCNIPINGGSKYGSAQRAGILQDIDALARGKLKATPLSQATLKFMVFIDLPQVRAANDHLIASKANAQKEFRLLQAGEVPRDPSVVYGIYAALAE